MFLVKCSNHGTNDFVGYRAYDKTFGNATSVVRNTNEIERLKEVGETDNWKLIKFETKKEAEQWIKRPGVLTFYVETVEEV